MSSYSSLFRVPSPFRVQTKIEENSLRSTDIMLGCIVLGEENAFPVDFDTKKTVGHLKGAIKEQAGLAEPAHKLILWQVNIPENEKREICEGIDIKEKFGGEKLVSDLKTIGQVFKEQPPSEHIHIIVELPATTGKRKAEDSDNRSQGKKKGKREYPDETTEGRDKLMVLSADRKETFINYIEKNHIGILRSPPSSGKSTLGEYFRDHYNGLYISMAGILCEDEEIKREYFDAFWISKIGRTWDEISNCKEKTYLFIDEIQFIYGNRARYFWQRVKVLQSNTGFNENLWILFLGTYHPTLADNPTPAEFASSLSLNDLLLTRKEFDTLVMNFVQRCDARSYFDIPEDVTSAIFNITNGHPGLCRFILRWLRDHFREGTRTTSIAEILQSLASSSLRTSIVTTSRAFHWTENWNPSKNEADFIRNMLFICRDNNFHPVDIDSSGVAKIFIKSGVFATDSTNGKMKFSAPITRIILSHRLFTSSLAKSPTISFEDFLTRTIERFCPTKLINSLGKGKGTDSYLFERTWQMEWYRSATTVVPIDATVSADVGPVFNSKGFLDFYVNGNYSWGIELLREGDKLQEHANRFLTDGIYSGIPLNQLAVLDFRCHSKEVRDPKQNFWYVCYSDDYKSFTIKRRDQADETLLLQGDNI